MIVCDLKLETLVNISKAEQRVLHALALGGAIRHHRDSQGRIAHVDATTREGAILSGCGLDLFGRLKRRGFIASQGGAPYRITRQGLVAVRAQLDQR